VRVGIEVVQKPELLLWAVFSSCHCEDRSDEAISKESSEIATPREVGAHNDRKRKAQIDTLFPAIR